MTTFNVYRRESNDSNPPVAIATGLTSMAYSDDTTQYGKRFEYQVGAVKSGIEKLSDLISVYAGTGDEYWENVAVLMHFNSSSGSSTSFYEEKTQTFIPRVGNTYIEAFGRFDNEGAVYFGRSGARGIVLPASSFSLLNQDFTIQASINFASLSATEFYDILSQRNTWSDAGVYVWYYYKGIGGFRIEYSAGGALDFPFNPSVNVWYDLKLSRFGDKIELCVNNVSLGVRDLPNNYSFPNQDVPHVIGHSAYFNVSTQQTKTMWFDEFRVTIGVAREDALLTEPFKNHK